MPVPDPRVMKAIIAPECEWHPSKKKIPTKAFAKLIGKIEQGNCKRLNGKLSGYLAARFSDYRAVLSIDPDDSRVAHIVFVAHRDDKTYSAFRAAGG